MKRVTRLVATSASALGLLAAAAFVAPAGASSPAADPVGAGGASPSLVLGHRFIGTSGPPTSEQCISDFSLACYGPADLRNEYDFTPAYARGDTGTGQTIVIFDSFGSPTIRTDLATFDTAYGIPAPPTFAVYQPEGAVTYPYLHVSPSAIAHNTNLQNEITWGYETTLDVEWAHAMAPGASLALVETPVSESAGVQGLQNMENAQAWALANHIGTIWSNSWAATEQSFHNAAVVQRLSRLYATAASQGVSAFFATGDTGAANTDKQGATYPTATVNFPSSDPNIVSVGGTEIPTPAASISSYQPEAAWNDGFGATGGGYSTVFSEPSYQKAASIPDPTGARGLPDVSYNAALVSSILVYESFDPRSTPSWILIGGTSAATPQWAAICAIAEEADGPLGFLGPRLYQVAQGPTGARAFHDITTGTTTFDGVTGYSAGAGWDPATGLGTPDVANLVAALQRTTPTP